MNHLFAVPFLELALVGAAIMRDVWIGGQKWTPIPEPVSDRCPCCDEHTGIVIDGEPFCILCLSQKGGI